MKIKGKSDKAPFNIEIPSDALLAFLEHAMEQADEQYDPEKETSPGGWPTALFTAILPANAREAAGWDIQKEGWDQEKAIKAFAHRLERKPGGGFNLEAKQKAWDDKATDLRALGADPVKYLGKRPEAKA
jgi:hypothetical protein